MSTSLDPVAVEHLLASMAGHSPRGDGGALLYLFETPDGSLLFQDTSGHWSGILDGAAPGNDAEVAIAAVDDGETAKRLLTIQAHRGPRPAAAPR